MLKLMIVDDSNVIRRNIERLHGNSLFKVVASVGDGRSAVEACREFKPDVVTMDITMPHLDGLEATAELIKIDPQLRILIVSALADRDTAIRALECGARGFLCKPFTEERIKQALEEIIAE